LLSHLKASNWPTIVPKTIAFHLNLPQTFLQIRNFIYYNIHLWSLNVSWIGKRTFIPTPWWQGVPFPPIIQWLFWKGVGEHYLYFLPPMILPFIVATYLSSTFLVYWLWECPKEVICCLLMDASSNDLSSWLLWECWWEVVCCLLMITSFWWLLQLEGDSRLILSCFHLLLCLLYKSFIKRVKMGVCGVDFPSFACF